MRCLKVPALRSSTLPGVYTHSDIVVDKSKAFKLPHHVRSLYTIAFQKLSSCRDIEEKILHHYIDSTIAHT